MNTTAQEAFKHFQDSQIAPDYDWDLLTPEQKQQDMDTYTKLKIEANKEIALNQMLAIQEQKDAEIARRNDQIAFLQSKGFACDDSLADWELLYNRPEIFGDNWKLQADTQFANKSDFINIAISLL